MMKSFIFSICFLLSLTATAQDTTALPKFNIKYNFTSILDISAPYVALSVEYPIAKRVSLEHELGYIYNRFGLFSRSPFRGIRSRNQLRVFVPDPIEQINISFDLHLVGKYIALPQREYDFARFDGLYNQQYYTSLRTQEVGFLIGNTIILYMKEAHASLEIGSGIGTKRTFSSFSNRDIPDDAQILSREFDFNLSFPIDPARNIFLIALINLKLGIFF